jgi:aminoglycoside phosphotransferase (APT) family kinase protein
MTQSRQDVFSGTREVRERHRFDVARLERHLSQHLAGFRPPLQVVEFKGGQSNPTYLLEAGGERYVLRRKPPGRLLPSAHAVDREYRVLTALMRTPVPAPRTYCLCTDESVIGTWFYVMEYVEGRVVWEPQLPGFRPAERAAVWESMVETLAALHTVDYAALGLADFGRPGNYFARQIGRWSKQYRASETEKIPEMDGLMDWLPRQIPSGDDETTLIHGDFKLDNVVLHPTQPGVVAVLDWELCTLGHPLGDLTYLCMPWWQETGYKGIDHEGLGIPTEEQVVASYCRRTGRRGIESWDFYVAYNFFRAAAICQGIGGRVRDGTAASDHAQMMAALVRPLAEQAWAALERLQGRWRSV